MGSSVIKYADRFQNAETSVWKFDYGNWDTVLDRLGPLLRDLPRAGMENVRLFVNNNLYNLELYVGAGFDMEVDEARYSWARFEEFARDNGGRRDSTLTNESLLYSSVFESREGRNVKRFNVVSLPDMESTGSLLEWFENLDQRSVFLWPPRSKFIEKDYYFEGDYSSVPTLFISHQSDRKSEARSLRDRLNSCNVSTWFDEDQIEYGQELIDGIDDGINSSDAVIFWISRGFIDSGWCNYESLQFRTKSAGSNVDVAPRIFTVVDSDVKIEELPLALRSKKLLQLKDGEGVSTIVEKLLPSINVWKQEKSKLENS